VNLGFYHCCVFVIAKFIADTYRLLQS